MKSDFSSNGREGLSDTQSWKELVAPYQTPAAWRSTWQMVNTLVPYGVLWYLMYRSLKVSYSSNLCVCDVSNTALRSV